MQPMIKLENVTKLYNTVLGVNDVSVELPPGGYGLLGPNGAGKSTLLNLLIGQLSPTRGTVTVLGVNPRNNGSLLGRIGFCPAFEGMYARVSGLEWLTYLLRLQDYSKQKARIRAEECLTQVGMQHAMHKQIASYSRGMRQRTKLAQAIAHEPELLILDEPLSGLDPIGRASVNKLLQDWIGNGRSLLIASHVLHEIEALTKSFLLISGGRLLASGTADDVHQMLLQVPMELQIRCSDPRRLAARILQDGQAELVKLTGNTPDDPLTVSTRNAADFSHSLMKSVLEEEISVNRLDTSDESLQSLFNSLMRIHRGEL